MEKINLKQKLVNKYTERLEKSDVAKRLDYQSNGGLNIYNYTDLKSKDGHKYSVLLEFDENKPGYGIYYGCKVRCHITKEKDIKEIDDEWMPFIEKIAVALSQLWNNDIDGTEQRILPSDTYSDNEYWPFWIRLGDSEDFDIAYKAMTIITDTLIKKCGFTCVQQCTK